jgi:hypothetical protein
MGRNLAAMAYGIVVQTVVGTDKPIVTHFSHAQWNAAMGTAIIRDRNPMLRTPNHKGLIEQRHCQGLGHDVLEEGDRVPVLGQDLPILGAEGARSGERQGGRFGLVIHRDNPRKMVFYVGPRFNKAQALLGIL